MDTIQEGSVVERNMFGIKQLLNVTKIDEQLIHCGPWTFDKVTGNEVDEDLSVSPSFIRLVTP